MPGTQRRREALIEGPRAPEADGRGEQQLDERPRSRRPGPGAQHHVAHGDRDERDRERGRDPQPARHVRQLVILGLLGGDRPGLERHAADRARAGLVRDDFRVHRTGPLDGAGRRGRADGRRGRGRRHARGRRRHGRKRRRPWSGPASDLQRRGRRHRARTARQPAIRIAGKLLAAAGTAEVVGRARVIERAAASPSGIDGHPADRINRARRVGRVRVSHLSVAGARLTRPPPQS